MADQIPPGEPTPDTAPMTEPLATGAPAPVARPLPGETATAAPAPAPVARPLPGEPIASASTAPSTAVAPPPPPVYDWQQPAEAVGPAPGIRFAGYGARLVGYIIDVFLIGVVTVVLFIALGLVLAAFSSNSSDTAAGVTGLLGFLIILVVTLGYFPYFWSHSGQTPGMRVVRIRVVRDRDGGPVTAGQAVLRLIGFWVSSLVIYLGYLWVFIDGRRRGWFDLLAGTVVIEA